jgi:integrase
LAQRQIIVRDGKGEKDRVTMLPESLIHPLQAHLQQIKTLHEDDLARGYGAVYLPFALERKYPNAGREWGWQYLFPARSLSMDPRSGVTRRHHLDESSLQKAVKRAVRAAGIAKLVSCHTLSVNLETNPCPNASST